ncbi:efflux RND transporter permease subunit [Dysgonomonas mossii]|uniref:efflux RND transporter permease subunit n=1 Tax=Dysgonomonas mossii TaxID=163665 RepID=UPI003993251D
MSKRIKISSFSVILAFVCLTLAGLALIPKLSVKLSPSQTLPQINISFSMSGSSPRTVEMEATSKLEAMLNRMTGVQKISSTSGNGWGNISMEFDKHTDMDIARFEVSTIVRQTWQSLPENVSYPSITQNRADDNANKAFLTFTINAPASAYEIQQSVDKQIKPKLSVIDGVFKIDVNGAMPMVWQIEYDSRAMDIYGISIKDIQEAIAGYLKKDFLGITSTDRYNQQQEWIRVSVGSVNSEDAASLSSIGVKSLEGTVIPLGKIARINKIESQAKSYYRINGLNSIYMSVTADENSNQLELSKKVKDKLSEIESDLPSGYEVHLSYDATEYIKDELSKIYFRTGLTLLILLLFILLTYRNIKYTLLVVFTLIANLATAIIFYYLLELEIQLYSLAGITISLTLIIDNTIVMSDQIIRRNNMMSFTAILAATMTTIASLSIIFFLDEKLRLNLQDFAAVIIVNLIISLFIALFLVPALLDKLNITRKKKSRKTRGRIGKIIRFKYLSVYLNRIYAFICRFLYRWRVIVITLLVIAFGLPVFLLPEKIDGDGRWAKVYNNSLGSSYYKEKIKPNSDNILGGTLRLFVQKVYEGSYFADREETTLYVTASLPNNSTIREMNELVQCMESYISQFSEIKQFQTNINNARQASINIQFTKEHAKGSFPYVLKSKLISKSLELGGGSWGVYGLGDGFSNDVRENAGSYRVEMYGFNYEELSVWAEKFKEKLLEHRRIKDVLIESEFSWFKDDYEEFRLDINKKRLAEEDIQPYQLYAQLNQVFANEISVGNLVTNGGSERIYLSSLQSDEYDMWSFSNIPLKINEREYKLSELANIGKVQIPQKVAKVNQQYRLCLQYEYIGAYEQGKKVLEKDVEEFQKILPMGYTIKSVNNNYWWGDKDKKQYWLLPLIFVFIYFISSILFNSLKQPIYIISVIPISFIGIFLAFYLFELNFDQGGFASFILLSGLTINANIYIIDEYNNIRKRSSEIRPLRVYLKAWNAKVRPICLTVISTILGFIPFLIGEHKEAFWFPLAVGTIGGLIVSLVATFLFLPLFMGVGKKWVNK